jgi:sulfatase modifying factor 1
VLAVAACGGRVSGASSQHEGGFDAAAEVGAAAGAEAGMSIEAAAPFEAAAPMEGAAIPESGAAADSDDGAVPDGVPSEEAASDVTIDSTPDVATESAVDASADVTPDAVPDSLPYALSETAPDAPAPSCNSAAGSGLTDCGPNLESCCITLPVPGGSFYRSYDGVSCPGGPDPMPAPQLGCYTTMNAPATVSGFRLDKYLVTVARFRRFVNAVVAGWLPAPGSGTHAYLNQGKGVTDSTSPGAFETGWDSAWNGDLPQTVAAWASIIAAGNFTALPTGQESLPMAGQSWTQAYAFCIWDGAFLPTEAEWNFAAAGGSEQRVYPWSMPPTSQELNCSEANLDVDGGSCVAASGEWLPIGAFSPGGDGRWGHVDLVGSQSQWTLDWLRDYVTPCIDCAALQPPEDPSPLLEAARVLRGGDYAEGLPDLLVSFRNADFPEAGNSDSSEGFRCARAP